MTTTDGRAVVRAIDALTRQVRRVADTLTTPAADASSTETTPTDDARVTRLTDMLTAEHCRSVDVDGEPVLVRGSGDFTEQDTKFFGEIVRAAKRRYETEHTPPDDEDALRWTRREALGVLLSRAERGVLTTTEAAQLRAHAEAEIRDSNTVREVAQGNRRHVQHLASEIDRLTAEVEQARELLRVAHETSNKSEAERATMSRVLEVAKGETLACRTQLDRLNDAHTEQRQRAEMAQAAIERVRAIPEAWERMPADRYVYVHEAARTVRAALDGTTPAI